MLIESEVLDTRYDYASATVTYIGKSVVHKADTAAGGLWYIWKYTYNETPAPTRIEGPINGNWDDRASISWAE